MNDVNTAGVVIVTLLASAFAVVDTAASVFSSMPSAVAVILNIPVAAALNVHVNTWFEFPAITVTGVYPEIIVPSAPSKATGVNDTLFAFALPLFVTLIYTVNHMPVLTVVGTAQSVADRFVAVSTEIWDDSSVFDIIAPTPASVPPALTLKFVRPADVAR